MYLPSLKSTSRIELHKARAFPIIQAYIEALIRCLGFGCQSNTILGLGL
jgi:hypothetical protein